MDITRGSRRARHVAATHANPNSNTNARAQANMASSPRPVPSDITSSPVPQVPAATPSGPSTRLNPSQGASPLAAGPMVTPDGPPIHRTPDQPPDQRRRRAPPPNPFRLYRTAQQPTDRSRLSMPPRDSDASSSDAEPDESILFNRARPMAAPAGPSSDATMAYNDDQAAEDDADQRTLSHSPEEYEDENSIGEEEDDDADEDEDDEEAAEHDQAHEAATLFDPATAGLKEISNLARFTVSSHKPGNGVEELKSDDLKLFWQSDGPQPHKLTMYFTKRVGIRDIRFYVDYNEDESYTPTKVVFKAGTSENNVIEFATMALENPSGWQQVPIAGAGGGPDGNTLVAWVVQMQILENHQNGKDTHLRGIKIYSFDNDSALGPGRDGNPVEDVLDLMDTATSHINTTSTRSRLSNFGAPNFESGEGGLTIPEFMREPEIR
ncbi:anaphase-promoting complex subunit 10 [Fusarium oxysporum f. sp. conglutinans race 2 54008]|uniref:Anaphase-promoting complex subunit 10 n=1 Tax=Fusarium oxysporum f. sp. conglutinans race 2 54008 TaxID=1089457 RepID=X0IGC6_FUSOX|nr:anaphase-promoting complex subunit 10 [Fusarium oxysporum f. sp. conglutinans race 2 54008]